MLFSSVMVLHEWDVHRFFLSAGGAPLAGSTKVIAAFL